jgi:catechol 2,3-dioxygenase-like lactoylglutathione lyase family enzyme
MSSTQLSDDTATDASRATDVPMRLEVVSLRVTDVDRAKRFYQGLGWRLDADSGTVGDFRAVQLTPPGSDASIHFGMGHTFAHVLAVHDIEAARDDLLSRGVNVSEVFHDVGGGLGGGFHAAPAAHAPGPDPERRSYASYAAFNDPDGNGWLLQEITERLPGRV